MQRFSKKMIFLAIVLILLLGGFIYQASASRRDIAKYPAPGQLVKTTYGDVHLNCQGEGDVTIILESGMGDSSLEWTEVQPAVAQFAKVCSYDRFGLGWSSPSKEALTATQIADNLQQALAEAKVEGPYLLVGHSIGGVYIRAFAQQFPEQVAGIVLIDSAHENQQSRLPAAVTKEDAAIKTIAKALRVMAPAGIPRALQLADRMQGDDFPDDVRPAAMSRMYQTHFFTALLNEVRSAEMSTTQDSPPAGLGRTPLIVLSQGKDENPGLSDEQFAQLKQNWNEMQLELAALSANSERIIAEKSGHYIHHDQPELVIDAIRRVVETVQDEGLLLQR